MRKPQRESQDFGLAFLDVISCGFGAIVMLVVLAKDSTQVLPEKSVSSISTTSRQLSVTTKISELEKNNRTLEVKYASFQEKIKNLELKNQETRQSIYTGQKGTEADDSSNATNIESSFSGGIPVDRDHVIFIVDTSGSMKRFWGIVIKQIQSILEIHPKIKGIQVMSDNGGYLFDGYASSWIPDTISVRKRIIKKLQNWSPYSNSSPSEGLERALRFHNKKSVSIYVLGDDFTGESYDDVLEKVKKLNPIKLNGERQAKIHGIGFPWGLDERFPTLMRELAFQNNGMYLSVKPPKIE